MADYKESLVEKKNTDILIHDWIQKLLHDNSINLIDIFQHKKRLYLVFEFVDHSLMEDLKCNTNGLEEKYIHRIIFQVLKGIEFCHLHNVSSILLL